MARTENDSWDLASSVGATATMVAAQRVLAHREGMIDDPYAEPLVRAVGLGLFSQILDGEIRLEDLDENFSPIRAAEGMAVRTRHFDRLFLDAAADGVRQAVILAAGLDARAYRLPWPDGTTVYEVDQPDVITFKSRVLAEFGAEPAARRCPVAIDLRNDWPAALADRGFDRRQPTAWIAEGLLIYLPPSAQDALFDNITALSAPGSRLATEYVPDLSALTDERAQRISERLKQLGSEIEMADLIYQGERNNVIDYLAAAGWQVTAQTAREAYAANGLEFPDDEMMTMFADLSYVSAVLK